MILVRIPLTLAAAFAFHVSMSPPTGLAALTSGPDTPSDRRAVRAAARFIAAMLTKGLCWAAALTDTFVFLAPHLPTPHSISIPTPGVLLSWIRPLGSGLGQLSSLALPFLSSLPLVSIAGTTLVVTGALLRHAAYHSLGQFYTCRNLGPGPCKPRGVRTRWSQPQGHAHALITTGPYAYVRHPGYAGLVVCTTGLAILHLDAARAYLRSDGASPWGVCGAAVGASLGMRTVVLICVTLGTLGAMWRIRGEEQALRTRFKGEWEAWAEKVRYRLVPGVY